MGDKFRTIQNLEIIKSDLENNLIFVKGSVPGSKNSIVLIKKNIKRIKRTSTIEKSQNVQSEITKTTKKTSDSSKSEKKDITPPKTNEKQTQPSKDKKN